MARFKREFRETELGRESLCGNCLEFWPADNEFFYFQNGEPQACCKACVKLRKNPKKDELPKSADVIQLDITRYQLISNPPMNTAELYGT